MDSCPAVAAAPPESGVPITFPSDPMPPAVIDPVAPPANAEETHAAEFMGAGDNAEDAAQENQRKRRPFGARARSRFRGWYGMRRGVGFRGKFHHHPSPVNSRAIHCHGSDAQLGKSALVVSYGQQLVSPEAVPNINLSPTGEEAMAFHPPALKTSLLAKPPPLPLAWCDICRVDCNSLQILEKHRTGKRHKRTVQLLEKMEGRPEMVEELVAHSHMKPEQHSESIAVPIQDMKVEGPIETSKIKCDNAGSNLKKKRKRNAIPEQPRVCVLCDAPCNSQAMFESHLAGKKHASRINHFQRPNMIYGLLSGYIPPNQSSTSASSPNQASISASSQDARPLYYGLMNCEQPQAYAVLNPHLEQAYELTEHLPLLDSGGQYGFIES